jgi:hypothetical protein
MLTALRGYVDAARFSADPYTWDGFQEFIQPQGGEDSPLLRMQTNWMLMKDPQITPGYAQL